LSSSRSFDGGNRFTMASNRFPMAPINIVCIVSNAYRPPNSRPGILSIASLQSTRMAGQEMRGCSPRRESEAAAALSPERLNLRLWSKSRLSECGLQGLKTDRPFLGPLPTPQERCRLPPKNLYRSLVSTSTLANTGNKSHVRVPPLKNNVMCIVKTLLKQ
jgi:hypothetical protein